MMLVDIIKEIIAIVIRFSGLTWFMREFIGRRRVTIIVYHNPTPKALSCHLQYLCQYYHPISLDDAVAAIASRNLTALPPKSLVLTFDDGYADNFALLDLFRRYQIRPTIYLTSYVIGTCRQYWFTAVNKSEIFKNKNRNVNLVSFLKNKFHFELDHEFENRQALSVKEISEMTSWVDFQNHGRYHLMLANSDDISAKDEIKAAQQKIEDMTGSTCRHFSYPFGFYSKREISFLKKFGYQSGRTTKPGLNDERSDVFRLKAIAMIPDNASKNMLCAQLSGLPGIVTYRRMKKIYRFRR